MRKEEKEKGEVQMINFILPKKDARKFKTYCAKNGTDMSTELRNYVTSLICKKQIK